MWRHPYQNLFLQKNFPFRWDLARIYREDFYDLQFGITNKYPSGSESSKQFNSIINGRFPYLNVETYQVEFQYVLPNKNLGTKAVVDYKNYF